MMVANESATHGLMEIVFPLKKKEMFSIFFG